MNEQAKDYKFINQETFSLAERLKATEDLDL